MTLDVEFPDFMDDLTWQLRVEKERYEGSKLDIS